MLAGLTPWSWDYDNVPTPPDPREVDTRWTAVWLHVIGGIVLPILYGVLGAGAAAGRMLSAKIRDNTLSPRDGMLAWTHVGLGSLIGGCIGLFLNPSDPSAAAEVSHLSTAALCFLAGFSVDAVFQLLERLTVAVFNVPGNTVPKKP